MTDPIHNFTDDDIKAILDNVGRFIEWEIEPKFYQLNVLVKSIKNSLIYFLPEDEGLIKDIDTADEATLIIKSCFSSDEVHPLKAGLEALRGIFQIINSDGKKFSPFQLQYLINNYLEAVKPYVLGEKVKKHSLTQSEKASRERSLRKQIDGKVVIIDPETRRKRNNEIIAAWPGRKVSANAFYIYHGKRHKISPSAVRKIIKSRFAPNPVKC